MPAVSKKQRRFMALELKRKKAGKRTKTGMTKKQLEEFARTPEKGLPLKKTKKKVKKVKRKVRRKRK